MFPRVTEGPQCGRHPGLASLQTRNVMAALLKRPARPDKHARSIVGVVGGRSREVRGFQLRVATPADAGPRRPQVLAERRQRHL